MGECVFYTRGIKLNEKVDYDMQARDETIDTLRGIGIIFVVLGHLLSDGPHNTLYNDGQLYRYIYSFHMPLFFILSGYCFKYRDTFKGYLIHKLKTLALPYYASVFISIFFTICFSNIYDFNRFVDALILSGTNLAYVNNFALWFYPVIFLASIIFYWMYILLKKVYINVVLIIVLSFCVFWFDTNFLVQFLHGEISVWGLSVVPQAVLFMCVGYFFKQIHLFKYCICFPISCLLLFFVLYYSAIFSGSMLFIVRYSYFIVAIISVILWYDVSTHLRFTKLMWLGRNSIYFFSLHLLVGKFIVESSFQLLIRKIFGDSILWVLVDLILIIIICSAIRCVYSWGIKQFKEG